MAPYIKQIPNKIIPEANDPIKKYFIPASLLLTFKRLLAAKIYNAIDKVSIPRKNIAKFPNDTIAIAPANKNILMATKSEILDCCSLYTSPLSAIIKTVKTINKLVKATEKLFTIIILLYHVDGTLYSETVSAKMAKSAAIVTGTIAFRRLNISAISEKTPRPQTAISVFILYI